MRERHFPEGRGVEAAMAKQDFELHTPGGSQGGQK